MLKKIVIINPSHQIHNACILGDTEAAHCLVIAKWVHGYLRDVTEIDEVHLNGTAPSSCKSEAERRKWSIRQSNGFYEKGAKCIHVAIHTNAPASKNDHDTRGLECFNYGSVEGKKLATRVYNALYSVFTVRRGVKVHPTYEELNATKAAAVIIEAGFHTNKEDAKIIHEAKAIARSIVNGILGYYGIDTKPTTQDYKAMYYSLVKDLKALIKEYE
jgi:hypothetical protein